MKTYSLLAAAITAATLSMPASALNIVLTNDDSWSTGNIQTLFTKLTEAGHSVVMSAPCTGQSGKGGAIHFMKPVNVDRSKVEQNQVCIGDTDETVAFSDFVEGTPVMAALYGVDVLAQEKWGQLPDLVISGPNEGNNLGYMTNNSGTLGAANVVIARGIPAIAVSAYDADEAKAPLVANVVVELVDELVKNQQPNQPLLPKFTGLNVNTPEDMSNHQGYKFSQVGWNTGGLEVKFAGDMSQDQLAMGYVAQGILAQGYAATFEEAYAIAQAQYTGKSGVSIAQDQGLVNDENELSEGVLIEQGYITISTIEANVQASRAKTALSQIKLNNLIK
ncbi:5'/3'-nucleotidase SurE [Pseudoalteromonas haloplanktis]|uniref:5'-nucleotidase n=1 Tax=Pseudoalteromonas haloplanktis TaxID=228 RepID=A0ABU1BDT3_PSEHA|nr:5'/3'-nucleotidase SurE [Pseudoalteromonas haloplanktis]MDQ9092094.1 5'/3'-nucleotidase SurE [Pseudoalteromonas haloplanktis]